LTKGPQHPIDGKQRVQILTLYGAARRVASRHFNEYDADIAAMYWTGLHVSAVLKLPSPLIRLAIVLERDPYRIGNSIGAYHALNARETATCERAYPEFLGLYDQMTRKPLRPVG
jgi:hypothetical protein